MAQSQVIFPGPRLRAFFRTIVAAEPTVPADVAERLTEACAAPIARMWVTHVPVALPREEARATEPVVPQSELVPQAVPELVEEPGKAVATAAAITAALENMAPWFEEADALREADQVPVAPPVAPGPPFDPFAFSAIALLKRDGREALLAKLGEIQQPADLKALADAQHLAIADGAITADALRLAIADSASRRLADRRAAAS